MMWVEQPVDPSHRCLSGNLPLKNEAPHNGGDYCISIADADITDRTRLGLKLRSLRPFSSTRSTP
jgi:hypothetical protein